MEEEFVDAGRVADFQEGKIRRYFLGGREVGVVYWCQRFYAFSNRCPHADFQLHFGFVEDDKIYCPIHYGEFNLETGKAQGGPWGISDLPVYEARVEGEYVQVKLPASKDSQIAPEDAGPLPGNS
jgi:nitrite reductase/ring-hydroxylating ferredoxin subunit